jgi:hypothetical protein
MNIVKRIVKPTFGPLFNPKDPINTKKDFQMKFFELEKNRSNHDAKFMAFLIRKNFNVNIDLTDTKAYHLLQNL